MTSVDLQAELERWINWNANSSEEVDFLRVFKELEEKGTSQLESRRKLREMGFIIDDYGSLTKVIQGEEW